MVRTNSEQQLLSIRQPSASGLQKEAALLETPADMLMGRLILGIQLTSEFKDKDQKRLSVTKDPKVRTLEVVHQMLIIKTTISNNNSHNSSNILDQITLDKKMKRKKRENKWITTIMVVIITL